MKSYKDSAKGKKIKTILASFTKEISPYTKINLSKIKQAQHFVNLVLKVKPYKDSVKWEKY